MTENKVEKVVKGKDSAKVSSSSAYDAKDIQILEGLDAVRLRPGMYIGTTGPKGLHHLVWEIVDNAVDEAANGFCSRIIVTLHKDGSVTIEDNGRGIPVAEHPVKKVSAAEVVFTELHAGGKFNNDNYAYSGGLHGVGASVVNALSRWLKLEINRDGKKYLIEFESKEDSHGKVRGGVRKHPLKEVGASVTTGTTVTFLPDDRIFETVQFNPGTIKEHLEEVAFLNRGLEIHFIVEAESELDSKSYVFKYDGGVVDFVKYINESKTPLYPEPIYISGESDGIKVEIAMQHTDGYAESTFSYVNNIQTPDGGTHEIGFKSGLTRALSDLATKVGGLKGKDSDKLVGDDFREGLTTVLLVKMKTVEFEGQTKAKLGNPQARPAVEFVVMNGLNEFFGNKKTSKVLSSVLEKAVSAAKVREASRKAKEIARQKNSIENSTLIGKLASCTGKNYANNEIFIVEGDSAGGSCKQARDRHFQAILPLRGKPLNVEKKRIDQVLMNEEFRTLISAIGAGIGEDFDVDAIKYNKVIILADADQDGFHIRSILLTFFFRYMKKLITNGHVFIGLPPLYRVSKKDKVEYVYSDAELPEATKRAGKGYKLQRYKGLGEMDKDQLWETTMDPAQRTLVQVTIDDAAEAEKMISTWMGDNVESRKNYISEHANFSRVDSLSEFMSKKK
ncbi:MAG: DNA gyrase subunit B [Clostridia bacterium]|nr:DNA gyrase subunit B [Clostridia bacterium]